MITINGGTENMLEGATTSVVGITSLQMGVFGGIIVGLGCFFAAQPFLQNRTATGIIVLRWNKIRTNYLFACIYRRWYPDVLYLASHPDRDLRTWRSCT